MSADSRDRRYTFKPNHIESLERRAVPSASLVPADLRNLSATVVGSAHAVPANGNGPGTRELDFTAAGKDQAHRPVSLSGSLITYDPASYAYVPGTFGSATLTTKHGTYHFSVSGPKSDLNATSGITNLKFSVIKSGPAPNKMGAIARHSVLAVGSIQIQRQAALDGTEQVTATIIAAAPWKARARKS